MPKIQRMRRRECAQAEQRERHGNAGPLGEVANLAHRAGNDDAVSGQNHRPLGIVNQFQRVIVFLRRRRQIGTISRQLRLGRIPVELASGLLRVLGDVDQHRARTAGARHVKSFADGLRHFAGVRHQIIVLGDGERDAGDVGFLKRVGPDQLAADLSGDADDRRRIQHRRRNAGDHVGRARSGGRDGHADSAARAGKAIRHVSRALFVAHQNVVNLAVLQRVVGGQNRAARISEHVLDAFALQALPQDARAGHGCRLVVVGRLAVRLLVFSHFALTHKTPCALDRHWPRKLIWSRWRPGSMVRRARSSVMVTDRPSGLQWESATCRFQRAISYTCDEEVPVF